MIRKSLFRNIFVLLCSTGYLMLIVFGYKQFLIWDQITDAFVGINSLSDISSIFADFNSHTLRLTLIFPLLILANAINVDQQFFFSLLVFFLLHCIVLNCNTILNTFSIRKSYSLFLYLLFVCVSLFMNGRIMFAFYGITLILLAFRSIINSESTLKTLSLLPLGLWFTSVSTGSFSVAMVAILSFFLITYHTHKRHKKSLLRFGLLLSSIFLPFIIPLMQINIQKNLDYYDGSFMKMLNHGMGIFLKKLSVLIFLIGGLILFLPFITYFFMKSIEKIRNDEFFCMTYPVIIGGILIGLFGFSSLITCLPAVFLILTRWFESIKFVN